MASVLTAAADLRRLLADFETESLSGADCTRISQELAVTERACAAVRLAAATRAVDSGGHASAGFKDPAAWLARQFGTTGRQAKKDLQTATRLEDCPETKNALLAGQISLEQAAEIAEAEAAAPGVEGSLVELARSTDLSRLRERAREERQARTPVADLHVRQHQARFFRHWRDQLGMVCFTGALPPEVGIPFVNRVEVAAARSKRDARAATSDRTVGSWEAYAADGLANVLSRSGDSGRSDRAELVVVCDINAFRRGHTHADEVCHIIGGGRVPVDVAKDLTKDAFLKAVLYEGKHIRTVKHFGRHIPAELRTALDLGPVPELTGRQCRECASRWGLEYDHINPVGNQGPTSYDNVQALCWNHHQAKTERDRRAGLIGAWRPDRPPDDG